MARLEGLIQERIRSQLRRYPAAVSEEFDKALSSMAAELDQSQLDTWAGAGVELAGLTVRSWEAAARYYSVSPAVVGLMPFTYFVKWASCGSSLCNQSPALAAAYFQASPGTISVLRSRHIESWADLGSSLYKGTWKSSTLSCKFFESSPVLLKSLTLPELEQFVVFLGALSHRSYDLAAECLVLGQKLFPLLGENKQTFIALASTLANTSWGQVKGFFDAGMKALPRIEEGQRPTFLNITDKLMQNGGANIPAVMLEISSSLAQLDGESHGRLLRLGEKLLEISPSAVSEFLKSAPTALQHVTPIQIDRWFEEGVRLLEENNEGGMAYFKLESAHSEAVLESLSSSVEFPRISAVMEMYCCALAGADIKLSPSEELVEKNIGWVSGESASTEGSSVFVPSAVDRYPTKQENFGWYKVVSTHQVAHLEFGSFGLEFERPSTLFEDLRPYMNGKMRKVARGDASAGQERSGLEGGWVTDMQRFFDQFQDRNLALDIFTVVEDGRLDARVKSEYRGIRQAYVRVQIDSLEGRPEVKSLPMREAMVEFLVRLSLQQTEGLAAPSQYVDEARKIARIARRVFVVGATVEDAAEATLRIYTILSQIPNEELPPESWQDIDLDDDQSADIDVEGLEGLLQQLTEGMESGQPEGEEEYKPVQDVDYRGDFKPELVQLLARLRGQRQEQDGEQSSEPITQEMLEELLKNSAELGSESMQGDVQASPSSLVDSMLKEAGLNLPRTPELGQGPLVHIDEDGGPLNSTDPQTFVYDEWDFRADDYKPRWCVVRQKPMAEGDPDYFGTTLHSYGSLVSQVRRQFELMVPEMFRKVRKLEDGDGIDIDDVIEAFVDIRTGVGPSEKLFWRRNKVQRDVAVVFLLDTSASTAEAIDEARKVADDWNAPDDPVEYMVWLRARRGEGMRRSYKRIIDLEKEAIVLLINALEAIGDLYGIYGFSGYGRENVEFYTIKDINERFSERVKRRIDRVAPLHATRMGPAIRHAASKLEAQEARTKLLFLISDGRPQDRGYSREGVEKEYAVHDTKKALDEAKSRDITAFCLTVDKNGHDYLKTMCQDIGYEVLDDIHMLPQRLLYLYKRLTM